MTAIAFVGAAVIGALGRWQATRLHRVGLPLGTFVVNVAAAFVAGLLTGTSTTVALIAVTAGLGSLSTFSTVAAEIRDLRAEHSPSRAVGYAVVTFGAGIAAAALGLSLAD